MSKILRVGTLRGWAAITGLALLLGACVARPSDPTEPVPQPPPEMVAMQRQFLSQLPTLQGMACFSAAVYYDCVIKLKRLGWFCAVRCSRDIAPGWLRGRQSDVGASSRSSWRHGVRDGRAAPRGGRFWGTPDVAN